MKKFFLSFVAALVLTGFGFSSVSSAGTMWKQVVNEIVYPNGPSIRQYPINDREVYSAIRVQVTMSDLRIDNALVISDMGSTSPLWQLNQDYRNGFVQMTTFMPTRLQGLRFDFRPLGNFPANVLVWVK